MSQLSFFSAESVPPAVTDLTGVLAGPGQVVLASQGGQQAARISVVVDELWRANGLAEMISDAGLISEISRTDENNPLVRTALDPQTDAQGHEARGDMRQVTSIAKQKRGKETRN
ncbi:hypothetical protein ABFW11_28365, partial [Mycolicibacterium porcinum]